MTQTDAAVVRRQIIVDAPIDRAFTVFTERFGDFKPPEHNLLGAPIAETVFEPKVGGNIVDRGMDGSECRWARILAYEPPHRVVFSWDISPQWQIETDPDNTSEVEVTVHRRDPGTDPGGTGTPAHRPARTRMAGRHRRRRRRRGLAALPGPLRRPVHGEGELMAPIITSTEIDRPADGCVRLRHRPDPVHQWQNGVVDGHMDQTGTPQVGARCLTTRRIGGANRSSPPPRSPTSTHPRTWGVRGIDGPIRATVDLTVEPLTADSVPADHRRRLRRPRHRQDPRPAPRPPRSRTRRCPPTSPH